MKSFFLSIVFSLSANTANVNAIVRWSKKVFISCLLLLNILLAHGQSHDPVKWNFLSRPMNDRVTVLTFTATIQEGWHLYSQFLKSDGPFPTTFSFLLSKDYLLIDNVKEESKATRYYDSIYEMDVSYFSNTAVFTQRVKLNTPSAFVKGSIEFMVCSGELCVPRKINFAIETKNELPVKSPERAHGTHR